MSEAIMTQEQFVEHSITAMHDAAYKGALARAQAVRDTAALAALEPVKPVVPTFHETAFSVAHLVDQSLPAKARTDYEAVCQRQTDVAALTREAETTLNDAMGQRQSLALGAARGEPVKPQTAAAAERAVRDAEANLLFLHNTAKALGDVHREAHDVLMAAQGLAHAPVLEHGIGLRIAAAAKLDAARIVMLEAERDWTVACDVVKHAVMQGAKLPGRLAGQHVDTTPRTEAKERAMWQRPVSA
jgi:hypothetical protein